MKKIMIMLFALSMTACMQEPQTDMQGLQAMGDRWQSAFDSKDASALAAMYSEDGAVLPPNNETVSGRAAIQAFVTDVHASGISFEIKDTEVFARGDVGYKVGTYTTTDAGGTILDEGKYVEIWRQIDDQWQLHRDIFNSNRPVPPDDAKISRVVVTAQVEDSAKWEEGFRTHGDLLGSMSQSATYFATTGDNEIVLYAEPDDLDKYMEVLESTETAEAMAADGVKRDTVKVFVLDKEFVY